VERARFEPAVPLRDSMAEVVLSLAEGRAKSVGAVAMTGTSSSIVRLTALLVAPNELSTCSTAPSAASAGSLRFTFLISATASCTRAIAGCELQPKALRRKCAANCQRCLCALTISHPPAWSHPVCFPGVSGSFPRSSDHDAPSRGKRDKHRLARNPVPLHADSRLSAPRPPPCAPHASQ
jgi:hypothetical protein